MDYSIIAKAGIAKSEAARIVGVSDVMMWKYVKTGATPRELFKGVKLHRRMEVFLTLLNKLVETKKLPKVDIPFSTKMSDEVANRRIAVMDKLRQLVDELAERVESKAANE